MAQIERPSLGRHTAMRRGTYAHVLAMDMLSWWSLTFSARTLARAAPVSCPLRACTMHYLLDCQPFWKLLGSNHNKSS